MLVAVRLPTDGLYTKCWLVLLARLSLTRAVLCPMVYAWRSWQTELDERRPRTMTIAARPLPLSLTLSLSSSVSLFPRYPVSSSSSSSQPVTTRTIHRRVWYGFCVRGDSSGRRWVYVRGEVRGSGVWVWEVDVGVWLL